MQNSDKTPGKHLNSGPSRSFREQALQIINMSLEEARTQHPLDVPSVFQPDRPTLGTTVPIQLYRAVRLLAFRELLGSRLSAAVLNASGQSVAQKMGVNGIRDTLQALNDLALAKAEVQEQTDDRVVITATECATCSGLPNIGEALCHFEAGFISGGLRGTLGNSVTVIETKCWGLGDTICRWEAKTGRGPSPMEHGGSPEPMALVATLAGKAALALDSAVAIKEANRQLRQACRRLRESERLTADLTNMVVHDLRVPLTAVIGSMQTLAETAEYKLSSNEKDLLSLAVSGGETLLEMINDLLDVSKLEEDSAFLRKHPTPVAELVQQACSQVEILARRKKLTLSANVQPAVHVVAVDRKRMIRVLVNLLGNAIRHTPPGGTVSVNVCVATEETCVVISVSDTGEGIPKEYLPRVFDKFAQVGPRRPRKRISTGLGLAFCKLVVEAHGGKIWVESEAGQGSTFTLTLPTVQTEAG